MTKPKGNGKGVRSVLASAEEAPPSQADQSSNGNGADDQDGSPRRRRRPQQSTVLVDLVGDAELWHSPDREAFATVPVEKHHENWPVRSKGFRHWLTKRYFDRLGSVAGAQAFEEALRMIEAKAIFEGLPFEPFVRVGEHDGAVFLDLADASWRVVKVTARGREIVQRPPVKFLRSNAMLALPAPEAGELIEQLRGLVNVRSEDDFKLLIGWLVGALRPKGPFPLLAINGEQGSAKSTLSSMVRSLIDPNVAPIRAAPQNDRELVVAARNSLVTAFDNLSDLPAWLSDALCRLSTGQGYSTRELYTDWSELVVKVMRPVILNGIPDLTTRPDLADRCIHITLQAISDDARRSLDAIEADFERRRPELLGALLDAVSCALRDEAKMAEAPVRMSDFARWVNAAEPALGWNRGDFLEAFMKNRAGAAETVIEADPIGQAVVALAADRDWEGTSSDLLLELGTRVSEPVRSSRGWPAQNKLSSRLRAIQPGLRTMGVVVDLDRRGKDKARKRLIGIRRPDRVGP